MKIAFFTVTKSVKGFLNCYTSTVLYSFGDVRTHIKVVILE